LTLQDKAAMQAAQDTVRVADMKAADFNAVFLPGDHGTMWDLPQDVGVARAVGSAFDAGKVVASVCHGAAGLVGAKKKDGTLVVAGLRVNSFTDAEETSAGLMAVMPFALESRLRELVGKFEGGRIGARLRSRVRQKPGVSLSPGRTRHRARRWRSWY
jgi:putative intracellular protease/amidase